MLLGVLDVFSVKEIQLMHGVYDLTGDFLGNHEADPYWEFCPSSNCRTPMSLN